MKEKMLNDLIRIALENHENDIEDALIDAIARKLDFDSIAAELRRIGYSGMITLESPACAEDETDKTRLLETFTLLSRVF